MSGCEGCFQSAKGMNEQLSIVGKQAGDYAHQTGRSVAIYREGYDLLFMDAEKAVLNGCNIIQIIPYNP